MASTSSDAAREAAGPAHVATVSFLASRAVPAGGFLVAVAGGTALARVAALHGWRRGGGAAIASMLETVAIMGPARFTVPLTQAMSAPLLGAMAGRGRSFAAQLALAFAIRVASVTASTAFFIFVITGGLDAYAGTYDNVAGIVGVHLSVAGTLVLTAAGVCWWGFLASLAQVALYRRGLALWDHVPMDEGDAPEAVEAPPAHRGRFDPRAVALAGGIVFALLLSGTRWLVLAAVAVWLVLAVVFARGDGSPWRTGVVLALVLGVGGGVFSLAGGLGAEVGARRALRAAMLVLVATWLRSAAGADGLRETARRVLRRARRLPAVAEAIELLDTIGSEGRLVAAGRSLAGRVARAQRRPGPLADAVLGWAALEAKRYAPPLRAPGLAMRVRAVDALVVLAAVVPVLGYLAG